MRESHVSQMIVFAFFAYNAYFLASGSLALKKLVVPNGLERHAELMAACESKGVEIE